jgi:hypothetical protein
MNIILPLKKIHAAAPGRKAGYLEECLRVGKVTGAGDSALIEFTEQQFDAIRRAFHPDAPRGLGDRAHAVLGPIGRTIHWPCMKGGGTTDLKPGSPCAKARNILNKIST